MDNAKWLGVPLTELLDRAGLQPEASQIVGKSVDGFTVGFPVDTAYDGRKALVAVGMNDEPLPLKHGFPGPAGRLRSLRLRLGHQVAGCNRCEPLGRV